MIKHIDTAILGLLLFFMIKGIWRGMKKEMFSAGTYGISLFTALSQVDAGTRFFQAKFNMHPIFAYIVAYSSIFFVVMLIIKFFAAQIRKLIQKEPTSGLIDSVGGAFFGLVLGVIIVAVSYQTFKPIPFMAPITNEIHKSIFLPSIEKYAVPITSKFKRSPLDELPLDQMMAGTPMEGMMMPGMLKGLLGGEGDFDTGQLGELLKSGGLGEENKDMLDNAMNALDPNMKDDEAVQKKAMDTYQRSLQLLKVDPKSVGTIDPKELLKKLKKKQ